MPIFICTSRSDSLAGRPRIILKWPPKYSRHLTLEE